MNTNRMNIADDRHDLVKKFYHYLTTHGLHGILNLYNPSEVDFQMQIEAMIVNYLASFMLDLTDRELAIIHTNPNTFTLAIRDFIQEIAIKK